MITKLSLDLVTLIHISDAKTGLNFIFLQFPDTPSFIDSAISNHSSENLSLYKTL